MPDHLLIGPPQQLGLVIGTAVPTTDDEARTIPRKAVDAAMQACHNPSGRQLPDRRRAIEYAALRHVVAIRRRAHQHPIRSDPGGPLSREVTKRVLVVILDGSRSQVHDLDVGTDQVARRLWWPMWKEPADHDRPVVLDGARCNGGCRTGFAYGSYDAVLFPGCPDPQRASARIRPVSGREDNAADMSTVVGPARETI